MRFDVLTIFPEFFEQPLKVSLLGKAVEQNVLSVNVVDIRRFTDDPHRKVDDEPFGGGAGMVMKAQPIVDAAESVLTPGAEVLLLAASGEVFDQALADHLATVPQVVIVCGRYEGVDERVVEVLGARPVSLGPFVLSGGEPAALTIIDAVARLIPGVMGNERSLSEESFSNGLLEYPQYTRPAEFRGIRVPDVLLSGDHARIARWRRQRSLERTMLMRPEMIEAAELSDQERVDMTRRAEGERRV